MTPLQHLLVAESVRKRINWSVAHRSLLMLGAVAPDAHRISAQVDHRDVHFRSRSTRDRRLTDFLQTYLRPSLGSEPGRLEFFAGWLTHIVADDVWRRRLQRELPELWEGIVFGRRGEADELRRTYLHECNQLDRELYGTSPQTVEMLREELLAAEIAYTAPPLGLVDIHTWRVTVVQTMLPPLGSGGDDLLYLSVEFVEQAIFQATEEAYRILQWEFEEPEISPIF